MSSLLVAGRSAHEIAPPAAERTIIGNCIWHFEPDEGGGMTLVISPVLDVGPGCVPVGWQYAIRLSKDGWKLFQDEVAAGEKKRVIESVPPPAGWGL